ncbi:hypothetical protein ABEV10_03690 [Bacillus velezensis]
MDKLGCKVAAENSYLYVNLTSKSPLTVKSFLSATKSFYKFACRARLYKFDNPLIDIQSVINSAYFNKSGELLLDCQTDSSCFISPAHTFSTGYLSLKIFATEPCL